MEFNIFVIFTDNTNMSYPDLDNSVTNELKLDSILIFKIQN